MLIRLFSAELRKLREPVTLLALFAAPMLAGALMFAGIAAGERAPEWADVWEGMTGFWMLLLAPLSATAFAAFAAQIEHRARGWDHQLMLPAPKWMTFAVKAAVVILGLWVMTALFPLAVAAGGWLGGQIGAGGPLTGQVGLAAFYRLIVLGAAAGLCLTAIQIWASLRFASFIAPVLLGFGGVAVTLAGMIFRQVDRIELWPWGMPMWIALTIEEYPQSAQRLALYGLAGGLAVLIAMTLHLSRREMR